MTVMPPIRMVVVDAARLDARRRVLTARPFCWVGCRVPRYPRIVVADVTNAASFHHTVR